MAVIAVDVVSVAGAVNLIVEARAIMVMVSVNVEANAVIVTGAV